MQAQGSSDSVLSVPQLPPFRKGLLGADLKLPRGRIWFFFSWCQTMKTPCYKACAKDSGVRTQVPALKEQATDLAKFLNPVHTSTINISKTCVTNLCLPTRPNISNFTMKTISKIHQDDEKVSNFTKQYLIFAKFRYC